RPRRQRRRLWRQALLRRLDGGNCGLAYIGTLRCRRDSWPWPQWIAKANIHAIARSLDDDPVGVDGPYDAARYLLPDLIPGHALRRRILEVRDGIIRSAEDHSVEARVRQRGGGRLSDRRFCPTRAEEIPLGNDRCADGRGRQTSLEQ